MSRKRGNSSNDLLPYKKVFQDYKDFKYSFPQESVVYRKRKYSSRNLSVPKVCPGLSSAMVADVGV